MGGHHVAVDGGLSNQKRSTASKNHRTRTTTPEVRTTRGGGGSRREGPRPPEPRRASGCSGCCGSGGRGGTARFCQVKKAESTDGLKQHERAVTRDAGAPVRSGRESTHEPPRTARAFTSHTLMLLHQLPSLKLTTIAPSPELEGGR